MFTSCAAVRDCVVSLVNVVCLATITRCTLDSDDGGAGPALFAVDKEGHRKATLALQEHIKPKKAAPAPDRRPSELAQQRRRLHPATQVASLLHVGWVPGLQLVSVWPNCSGDDL